MTCSITFTLCQCKVHVLIRSALCKLQPSLTPLFFVLGPGYSVLSVLLQAKRSSRPEGPILEGSAPIACPVGKNDRIGVKCLPYGMRSLFHRG
jgi:hypothetical protein